MKTFVMLMVIVWFVFGDQRCPRPRLLQRRHPRTCDFVGSAALTVIAGPLGYVGVHPHAYC